MTATQKRGTWCHQVQEDRGSKGQRVRKLLWIQRGQLVSAGQHIEKRGSRLEESSSLKGNQLQEWSYFKVNGRARRLSRSEQTIANCAGRTCSKLRSSLVAACVSSWSAWPAGVQSTSVPKHLLSSISFCSGTSMPKADVSLMANRPVHLGPSHMQRRTLGAQVVRGTG